MKRSLLLYLCFLVLPCICFGTIRHVPGDYETIQAAIDAAGMDDTVMVADGVYSSDGNWDIDFLGKQITVISENGPEACIIDINGSEEEPHQGFLFVNSETTLTVLSGFTIQNGYVTEHGGGVYCNHAAPTISNCIFRNNTAEKHGGGLVLMVSNARVMDCLFDSNDAEDGAGIAVTGACHPVITNCTLMNGTAGSGGAIIANGDSFPLIVNCDMFLNSASGGGFAHSANGSTPTFLNCTATNNTSYLEGALYMYSASATVINSIFWNNQGGEIVQWSGDAPSVTHSNIFQESGVYPGTGNINSDPLFIDAAGFDFRLNQTAAGQSSTSPCVDSGDRPAASLCFHISDGLVCMDTFSTRTDDAPDSGVVDMGVHYPETTCPTTGCSLWMPDTTFAAGDTCSCQVTVCNATGSTLTGYPLFVILDLYSAYYFAPAFNDYDHYLGQYPQFPAGETVISVLPDFPWPTGAGNASGIVWYAALTDPGITDLYGEMDTWTFGWSE